MSSSRQICQVLLASSNRADGQIEAYSRHPSSICRSFSHVPGSLSLSLHISIFALSLSHSIIYSLSLGLTLSRSLSPVGKRDPTKDSRILHLVSVPIQELRSDRGEAIRSFTELPVRRSIASDSCLYRFSTKTPPNDARSMSAVSATFRLDPAERRLSHPSRGSPYETSLATSRHSMVASTVPSQFA